MSQDYEVKKIQNTRTCAMLLDICGQMLKKDSISFLESYCSTCKNNNTGLWNALLSFGVQIILQIGTGHILIR